MRSDASPSVRSASRTYYSRGRTFTRCTCRVVTGMFALFGLWGVIRIFEDSTFAPFLILYIPVALYDVRYYYALSDTCVITSETGIEYKRPEFTIVAAWSQIKSVRHGRLLALVGVTHYLVLDSPSVSYAKWFGTVYRLSLMHIFFPGQQRSIPIGPTWQSRNALENEILTKRPDLSFGTARDQVAA